MKFLKNTVFLNQQWVIKINIKRVIKSHISTIWEKRKNGMGSIYRLEMRGLSEWFLHFPVPVDLHIHKVLQYIEEGLWTCCGQCGVSSESYLSLANLYFLQSLQLPLKHRDSGYSLRDLNHCPCTFWERFPLLSFAHTALVFCFVYGPATACESFSHVYFLSRHKGVKVACLYRLTFSVVLGEFSRHHWVCGNHHCGWSPQGRHSFRIRCALPQRSWSCVVGTLAVPSCLELPAGTCGMLSAVWDEFCSSPTGPGLWVPWPSQATQVRRKWLTIAHNLVAPVISLTALSCLLPLVLMSASPLLGLYNTAGLLLFSTH